MRGSYLLRYTTFHIVLYSTTNSCSLDDGEPVDDVVAVAILWWWLDDGELNSCVVGLGSGVEGVG